MLLLAGAFANAGQAAFAADLLSVTQQALSYDSTLASARSSYLAAEQAVPKARVALLPRVDAGWGRTWNNVSVESSPDVSYWQNGWRLALSQPVFDWNGWVGYQQAELVYAQAGLTYASEQQNLLLRVAEAYFQILAAEEELERSGRYLAALDSHRQLLEKKQAAGEATIIDLQDARTSLEQAELQREQAREDVRLKSLQLTQMTGQDAAGLSRLRQNAILPPLQPASEAAWVEQAVTRSYPVQLGLIGQKIVGMETDKIHAEHYPVVSLSGNYTPAGVAGGYSRPTTTTVAMLQVSMPLFAGGGIQARVKESRALEQKAGDDANSAIRQSERLTSELFTRVKAGYERLERMQKIQKAAQAALDGTLVGYQVGSRSSVDILRAMDTFYASQSNLIRGRYEIIKTVLQLKASAASLSLGDIEQINTLLQKGADVVAPASEVTEPSLKKAFQIEFRGAPKL